MHEPGSAHSHTFRVRYAECDPMGIAHHASFILWLEQGRIDWLRQQGVSYRDLEAEGVLLPVTHLDIRYRQPALFDDLLQLHTVLEEVGASRVVFRYELQRPSVDPAPTVLATARVELATIGRNGKPRRLPVELRSTLLGGASTSTCD